MVKRWIVMIVIAITLVVGGILETNHTHKTFEWLIGAVSNFENQLELNKDKVDTQELIDEIVRIDSEWSKRVKGLKCLVWHSGVKDIEVGLARIAVYVKEDDATEALAECSSLIGYSVHCLNDFKITLENVL